MPLPAVLKVKSFRDLMAGQTSAEIRSYYEPDKLVRRLAVTADTVTVDALSGRPVTVPLDTEIRYEPWMLDRGSLLFSCTEIPIPWGAKLCTEADFIVFPDGSRRRIFPANDCKGAPSLR